MRILQHVLIHALATLLILIGVSQTAQAQALPAPVLREAFPLPDGAPPVDPNPDPDPDPDPTPGGTVSFTEDTATDLRNPERGFYRTGELDLASSSVPPYSKYYDTYRQTLAYDRIDIGAYKGNDHLPSTFLNRLRTNFAAMRGTGVKAVIRFVYGSERNSDATKARQLNHIADVGPVLKDYADVIAYVEAGFIGQFGEWHDSAYIGNDPDNAGDMQDMADIAAALMDSVPASRMVAFRAPRYTMEIFGSSLFPASSAFSGSDRARAAAHADGFVTNKTHGYTIQAKAYDQQMSWLSAQTAFSFLGGESNGVGGTCTNVVDNFICKSNSDCTNRFGSGSSCDMRWSGCNYAKGEAARLHFTALNDGVNWVRGGETVQRWKNEGCYDEIKRKMGYRLVLKSATFPASVSRGKSFGLTVNLKNDGYGRLFNARTVYATIKSSSARRDIALRVDPRMWDPGGGNESFTESVAIPADLPTGTYELSLWLPDAANTLKNDSKYAVRFANSGTWNNTLGLNKLGTIKVE